MRAAWDVLVKLSMANDALEREREIGKVKIDSRLTSYSIYHVSAKNNFYFSPSRSEDQFSEFIVASTPSMTNKSDTARDL